MVTDTLEELLNGGGVTDESRGHLETAWRNRAKSGLDVVGNPFDEVGGVLVLDVAHLVLNLLHGDLTTAIRVLVKEAKHRVNKLGYIQDGRAGKVAAATEVGGGHHVLGIEHLLGQLRHGDGTERVGVAASKGSKSNHEEVETREWNHVDGQLAEVRVELTWETKTGADTGHDGGDEVVKITVGWVSELEGSHADVVQGLQAVRNTEPWPIKGS